jgi:ketosteroid isomerase-like protein
MFLTLVVIQAVYYSVATSHPFSVTQRNKPRSFAMSMRILALVLLVPGLVGQAIAQDPDSAAVAATVTQYQTALAAGDSTAAVRLLAPDVVILESGGMETLAEYRAHHLPADIAFAAGVPAQRSPLHVVVVGDVAWVTSTSVSQGEVRGRQINSRGAELMVLTRTPGGWRIRAIHWSSRSSR